MCKGTATNGKLHQMMWYVSVNTFGGTQQEVVCQNEVHELPTSESARMLVKYARTPSQPQVSQCLEGGPGHLQGQQAPWVTLMSMKCWEPLWASICQYPLHLNKPQQSGLERSGPKPRGYTQTPRHEGMWSQRQMTKRKDCYCKMSKKQSEIGIITRDSKKMCAWDSKNFGLAGVEG